MASEKAAEMLQNLSLESPKKSLDVAEPAKKTQASDRSLTPLLPDSMDPALCYLPGGYGYYYGSYNGAEWDDYSRYTKTDEVEMTPGLYVDSGSFMYHNGYGYAAYGSYSPATLSSDAQIYGTQNYQYPPYFQPTPTSETLHPSQAKTADSERSTNTATDRKSLPVESARTNSTTTLSNGVVKEKHSLSKPFNPVYSQKFYSQYRNNFRSSMAFGSGVYDPRINTWFGFDNKLRTRGKNIGSFNYRNEKIDGLNELIKGPRVKVLKEQNLQSDEAIIDEKENTPSVPSMELYNKSDFPEHYADAKFFIIKSYSEDDVHKSVKYNVWASTPNGNKKLNAAYEEAHNSGGCPVFLFFSVNTSGQFVGLAEMVGRVDFDKNLEYWQQDKWTGCFPVKWHIVKDVPNNLLKHIIVENNENKPVTNSRDTQEIKLEQGLQMIKIFKEHSSKTCLLDDFEFYEKRQRILQEKKAKQKQFHEQASEEKANDEKKEVANVSLLR